MTGVELVLHEMRMDASAQFRFDRRIQPRRNNIWANLGSLRRNSDLNRQQRRVVCILEAVCAEPQAFETVARSQSCCGEGRLVAERAICSGWYNAGHDPCGSNLRITAAADGSTTPHAGNICKHLRSAPLPSR